MSQASTQLASTLLAPIPTPLRRRLRLAEQPGQTAASAPRVVAAGVAALLGSVAVAFVLAEIGRAAFTVPPTFDKFNFGGYAFLTTLGVLAATVGWPLTQRVTPDPRWLYLRAAAVISAVLLLPDVWLFTQAGNPAGPVFTLVVMHLAIAVVTYLAMTRLAPSEAPTSTERAAPPTATALRP